MGPVAWAVAVGCTNLWAMEHLRRREQEAAIWVTVTAAKPQLLLGVHGHQPQSYSQYC